MINDVKEALKMLRDEDELDLVLVGDRWLFRKDNVTGLTDDAFERMFRLSATDASLDSDAAIAQSDDKII